MAPKLTRRRWRRPKRMTLEGPPPSRRKDIVVPDVLTLEPELAWRQNRTRMAALLAVFLTLSTAEGVAVGLAAGLVVIAVPAAVALALAYLVAGARFGDGWIRAVLGASPLDSPKAANVLEGVCSTAGVTRPELYAGPGEATNALAMGLRRRWVLVTPGTTALERVDMEGLLAHEVVHLRDGDAALASAYVLIAGAPELALGALRAGAGPIPLLAAPLWPACLVVRLLGTFFSAPDREHRADVAGALMTRYPPGLRNALRRAAVEQGGSRLRTSDAFWFAPRAEPRGRGIAERADLVGEM